MNPEAPNPPPFEPTSPTSPTPPPTPPPPPAPPSEVSQMMAKLGAAERLLLLGAAIVVGDYLLFDLIIGEYSFSHITLLMAVWAIGGAWIYHQRSRGSWPVPYSIVLKVVGYTAGIFGANELLVDVRYGVLDRPADFLGGLLLYAGAGLMLWGARSLPKS